MARKRRRPGIPRPENQNPAQRNPKDGAGQGSRLEIDSFLGSAKQLRDFVAAAHEEEGKNFERAAAALPLELSELLGNVRLVARLASPPLRMPQQLRATPPRLGVCQFTLQELLPMVHHALNMQPKIKGQMDCLNSPASLQILQSGPWQSLHRLLGDGRFFRLLAHEIYLHVPPGSRWLQLAGRPRQLMAVAASAPQVNPGPVATKPHSWRPGSIFVERRIFYSCRFAARAGLPLRSAVRRVPASRQGAECLLSWILSPQLFCSLPSPDLRQEARPRGNRHERRRRGPRKGEGKREEAKPSRTSSHRFTRAIFDALIEPVLALLQQSSKVKFQAILGSCCPAKHEMMILKTFEAKNPKRKRQPETGLKKRMMGLRCLCSRDGLSQGEDHTCTGGEAEIYFMKNFPAASCAQPSRAVASFIISSLRELLGGREAAKGLLGSKNWHGFCDLLRSFVYLRRGEELSLHNVLQGLSVRSFQDALLSKNQPGRPGQLADKAAMSEALGRLCYFLLAHVAVPLLREHFYATEAEPCGTQTVFFRKHIWHFIRTRADCGFLHLCMRDQSPTSQPSRTTPPTPLSRRSAGQWLKPPTVRWVPKRRGLRPIVTMAKWASQQAQVPPRVQRQVLPVLAHLRASHPNVLGRSLLSQNEVHARLVTAFEKLKGSIRRRGQDLSQVKLFVAVADLRNCYDRIGHDSLLSQVAALPLSHRYRVTKVSAKRALGTSASVGKSNRLLDVALAEEERLDALLLSERCPAALRKEPLIIQPSGSEVLRLSDVIATLRSGVQGSAATLGTQPERSQDTQRFLLRGIPQGGRFSPFLCALHMGAGDAALPSPLLQDLKEEAFFFRLVDDFLYVCAGTPEPCCRFLTGLASKENAFQGELNLRKCKSNFPMRVSAAEDEADLSPRFEARQAKRRRSDVLEVPWAGLCVRPDKGLLNIGTSKPAQIRDTLAITHRSRRRAFNLSTGSTWQGVVRSKLMVFLDLKLQPLLVDPRLNSDACVQSNVSSVCKLCAQRFIWLLLRRGSSHLGNVSPAFVTKHMLRLVWRAAWRAAAARASVPGHSELDLSVLCLRSFLDALRSRRRLPLFAEAYRVLQRTRARLRRAKEAKRGEKKRMDHMVAHVVDLALRAYRATDPKSRAERSLSELLRGLGYVVNKKGDLAGIEWKDWKAFRHEEAFEADARFLKALLATAFSDNLFIGGYGSVPAQVEANTGKAAKKARKELEAWQKEMETNSCPPRESLVVLKGNIEDPDGYVEFVCGTRPKAAISLEPKEATLVHMDGFKSEASRWAPLHSRAEAPLLVSQSRLPAEFNLLSQFEKHMQELQRARITSGWTYKPAAASKFLCLGMGPVM
ncbi:TERT [Symbiodinium sp. CCMP2456]|nr:TERT [Symbiodinium sp. CCMP2456]